MKAYADTLREQELRDPELTAAREKLITRMMHGPALDRAPVRGLFRVVGMGVLMMFLAPVAWVCFGVAFSILGEIARGLPPDDGAATFTIAFYLARYAAAAVVLMLFFGGLRRQLAEPRRLRALDDVAFLAEVRAWEIRDTESRAHQAQVVSAYTAAMERERVQGDTAYAVERGVVRATHQLDFEHRIGLR